MFYSENVNNIMVEIQSWFIQHFTFLILCVAFSVSITLCFKSSFQKFQLQSIWQCLCLLLCYKLFERKIIVSLVFVTKQINKNNNLSIDGRMLLMQLVKLKSICIKKFCSIQCCNYFTQL